MKEDFYIFSQGVLERKNHSLCFQSVEIDSCIMFELKNKKNITENFLTNKNDYKYKNIIL